MKRILTFVVAAVAVSCGLYGAPGKRASSIDIFGIAIDAPLPEYIKPADTNGVVTVYGGDGSLCVGRVFCGMSPTSFDLCIPDKKGRTLVWRVRSVSDGLVTTRADWLFKWASEKLDGYENLRRYAVAGKAKGKRAEWYGVGTDGVPFAVTLNAGEPVEGRVSLQCEVMRFAAYADYERCDRLPVLREKDRARRLALADRSTVAKYEKMMREKSYSGMWACKAKCFDRIAFCFDKSGIGCFDMVLDGFMVQQVLLGGWFHWTADDNGQITVHACPTKSKAFTMALKYDYKRNMMVPDVNAHPFSTKVIPNDDNPNCEMKYVMDFPVMEALRKRVDDRRAAMKRLKRQMEDECFSGGERRDVASLDEFIGLAKGMGENCVLSLAGEGCPKVLIVGESSLKVYVFVEIARGGDAEAPKFDCIAGQEWLDIAGKKELEVYFDAEELEDIAESNGLAAHTDVDENVGIWTWEKRTIVSVSLERDEAEKLAGYLKAVVGKWYKFPVTATVITDCLERFEKFDAKFKELESL